MVTPRKPSLIEKLSKKVFLFIWFFVKKTNPNTARRLLYWGITDQAFLTEVPRDPVLQTQALGKTFQNPIGISAGFDNSFKYNDELVRIGFGFSEFGTFTYHKDRDTAQTYFLPRQEAILVDSPSWPNPGIQYIQKQLIDRRRLPHIAGVSISSSLEVEDKDNKEFYTMLEQDVLRSVQLVAPYCDFITLNLSHPTMPITNLIHVPFQLASLLRTIKDHIQRHAPILTPKLVVKLPLELTDASIPLLADVFMQEGVDAVIIAGFSGSKSQKQRLGNSHMKGFVTGRPLMEPSTLLLSKFYQATKGKLPLIASGGVFTGEDAYRKICAGATLVQIHTALLFKGPDIANDINQKLALLLKQKGFKSVNEAVGSQYF